MRAPELLKKKKKQVPSAFLQKFRLKINIAAHGEAAGVLVALGLLQLEVSTSEIRPPAESQ